MQINKQENHMLIFTRKTNECFMIGDEVAVKILDIRGTQVRIGIAAPQDVSVHRHEVYERIQAENENKGRAQ